MAKSNPSEIIGIIDFDNLRVLKIIDIEKCMHFSISQKSLKNSVKSAIFIGFEFLGPSKLSKLKILTQQKTYGFFA